MDLRRAGDAHEYVHGQNIDKGFDILKIGYGPTRFKGLVPPQNKITTFIWKKKKNLFEGK